MNEDKQMIIVIADDFTGAAELAGVGLSHGLEVELLIEQVEPSPGTEMLVLATDTRSSSLEDALESLRTVAREVKKYHASLVYKKIDSVLRGHILEEIQVLIDELDMVGAILVPANPVMGRVIIDGHYYVNGEPLQSTSFSQDPEFEINTSSVSSLLSRNGATQAFRIVKPADFKGRERITVGEASSGEDLDFWAEKAEGGWLPVGAAGFFQSLLKRNGSNPGLATAGPGLLDSDRILYICGSTFHGSKEQVGLASEAGPHVCYMPEALFNEEPSWEEELHQWVGSVRETIETHGKAVVAVKQAVIAGNGRSEWIRKQVSVLVEGVLSLTGVNELVIEGGSTASAILYRLGLTSLKPFHQFTHGVIRMELEGRPGMYLTLKPGSYTWPESVWKF